MKLGGLRRFWIALAIVPLLAGVALASVPATWVCSGDLIARTSCCCPNADSGLSGSQSPTATLSARCCCNLTHAKPPVGPTATAPRATTPAQPQPVAVVSSIDLRWLDSTLRAEPTGKLAHPPPLAVPILLAKQSFLI